MDSDLSPPNALKCDFATLEAHAAKCELAAEVLRTQGNLRLGVTGWSMFPSVRPGDVLVVDRTSSSGVSTGEIVLFGRNRRLFVHRVVGKELDGSSTVLTRGDAMPQPDAPVNDNDLLGRVSCIVRNGKHIVPRRTLRPAERAVATLVRRSNFVARVVVGVHGLFQASAVQTA